MVALSAPEMLVDVVGRQARAQPERAAFTFLRDGEGDAVAISYGDLDRRARALAVAIGRQVNRGARVLLLTPPGLDFVVGALGTLYAGAVLVPSVAPGMLRPTRMIDHIRRLAADAGATVALTSDAATARAIREQAPDLADLCWLAVADVAEAAASRWQAPALAPDDLALLQYTSGSTQRPKGVMISHGNLTANLAFLQQAVCRGFAVEGVMWVPPYHDMGLVGGIFLTVFNGHHVTLLSPAHFLQRPLRWLQAIARSRATHTAAPNFALDLCVRRTTPEQRAALDLRSLRMLLCGGEPVRAETVERFAQAFAASGFNPAALTPAYGLAESTVLATAAGVRRPPVVAAFDATALRSGTALPRADGANSTHLVGCGKAGTHGRALIVDPEDGRPLLPGKVGEIWLAGPSITDGYWNRREETHALFGEIGGQRYLRSGDLGFLRDGELFVVGRAKDVIIIHGHNHHPQDIEETVEAAEPALLLQGSAAFGLTVDGEEQLAVVAEIEARADIDPADIVRRLRKAIAAKHNLPLSRLALIRKRSLPKTTSGKVRRGEARRLLLAGELPVLHAWEKTGETADHAVMAQNGGHAPVLAWLRQEIARATGESAARIPADALLSEAGLTSVQVAELLQRAETKFGTALPLAELSPDLSVEDLVALVAGAAAPSAAAPASASRDKAGNGRASPLAAFAPLRLRLQELADLGLENPFFSLHEGTACDTTHIGGRELINFASYNYLGLSGHPAVNAAAKQAIDAMGTSVSASRLVSGERPLHRELERAIADLIGAEDAIVFVSGNLTNVTVVGHLAGPEDLVVRDALAHDSILQGAKLSGAAHRAFPHNDWRALDALLAAVGGQYRQVFIAIEGVYSMDGDIPDLRRFIDVKRRHGAWLLVDEAHSIGVLGERGRGIVEHAGVAAADVDLWMGTLSKSFASCGGYIAGSAELVEYLKYTAPGFVFSVGMPPASTAAALAAIRQLAREPERVTRLQQRAGLFLDLARAAGLDTGQSGGSAVVPVILGQSIKAIACAAQLRERGINVQPVVYPAVEEDAARLRFFVCADHSPQQIRTTVATVASVVAALADMPLGAPPPQAAASAGASG